MPDPADIKLYAKSRTETLGVHWPTYEKQIQQESGWSHWSSPGVVKSSPTGSMGLGQLNSRFYPESDWRDPYTNISKSIEIMANYLAKFGTYRKALAAYNWGPGHVGGGRFDDGRGNGVQDHSPWDGTRAWRCSAGHGMSAQAQHYLDVILGTDWPEPTTAPAPPSGIVYEDFRDPAPAGRFAAMPKGIILHGSRSGIAGNPKAKEYTATANWEVNNPAGLGWHATIGENRVALHLTPQEWGWHALQASKVYLGVELAQATVDEPITDPQVAALADWIETRVLPVWPTLPLHFPSHAEADVEFNQSQGKSDVFPLGDVRMTALRTRLRAALNTEVPAPSPYSVGAGILAKMSEYGDAPSTDEMFTKRGEKDEWSEAYGQTGSRYLYVTSLNRVFRFSPAA